MKKLVAILCAACITLFVSACEVSLTPEELYEKAAGNVEDSLLYDVDTNMSIEVAFTGGTMEVGSNLNIKVDLTDAENPKIASSGTVTMPLVGEVQVDQIFADGVMYSNVAGQKTKSNVDYQTALDLIQSGDVSDSFVPSEDFLEITAEKDGDNTVLHFNCKTDETNSFVQDALGEAMGEDTQYSFEEISGTVVVDKDEMPVSVLVRIKATMEQEGQTFQINAEIEEIFHSIGQPLEITAPADAASYADVSAEELEQSFAA